MVRTKAILYDVIDFSDAFGPLPIVAQKGKIDHLNEFASKTTRTTLSGFQNNDNEREGNDKVQDGSKDGNGLEKLGREDFELLKMIGKGSYGTVFQVQKKGTSEIYAMKVMRKETIVKQNQVKQVKSERNILTKVVHPFIVQLRYSFQTKDKLYLVMDFISGGDLYSQLFQQVFFNEDLARVYGAEIVLALAHLHKNGIIHRDVKLENVLFDADGYVMLADFGLAKEVKEDTPLKSFCGTMEYMAPEIIQYKGYGKEVDWWSFGILLFVMLTGKLPFSHKDRQKLQEKIVDGQVHLPKHVSCNANDLLIKLLQKNPCVRLGNGPKGSDDIKQHKWFESINWEKLELRQVTPSFSSKISCKDCTANFDEMLTRLPLKNFEGGAPQINWQCS